LNGAARRDPETPVQLDRDRIDVDGSRVEPCSRIYLIINKPRGIVTTASDEKGRDSVYALLDPNLPWVGPVGRLDKASEGLLLLTNDSEWAARISDPESHLDKTYHVQVRARPEEIPISTLRNGMVHAGESLRAKSACILRSGEKNTWLEIVLDEGRNRQIRRLFEAIGIEVIRLIRVTIGPLALGPLPKGAYRQLSPSEKSALDRSMAAARGADRSRVAAKTGRQLSRPAYSDD
jgi:23S rRNA pseudouridine2605 synthase